MRNIVIFLLLAVAPGIASAKTYKLEGAVGGLYPVVIELEESDGRFFGRYAYLSTLAKSGDIDCSWLQIIPSYEQPASQWDVRDCKLNPVETWYNVTFSDGQHLSARMKNVKGKTYEIKAKVTSSSNLSPSMTDHFKSHLGEYPSEFHMFSDPSIQDRWEEMMGRENFDYVVSIYQSQSPIEYSQRMFHSAGFVARQCCDPAVAWAYDTDADAFYVWVRKDDKEYWWSKTGQIPLKFREIVAAH